MTSSTGKKKRTPEEIARLRKKKKLREAQAAEESTPKKKRGLNLLGYRQEMESLNTRTGDFFKLDKPGKYRVRFMPNVSNDGFFTKYAVRVWLDTARDDGEIGRRPYFSPRCDDKNAYCPGTAAWRALAEIAATRKKDKELQAQVNDARPEQFYISNALVYDKPTKEWKQVVLYMSAALFRCVINEQLARAPEDEPDELDNMGIADIKTGRKVLIERKNVSSGNPWSVSVLDDVMPLTKEQLDARVDLDDLIKPSDAETLEELVCEQYGVGDISELTKGAKSKTKSRDTATTRKKKKATDIIEDDEEEDDDDDEEDDDVIPLDDEDEDDEEDDDLDDEEDDDDEDDD